jgi:hypothetical protein
MVAKSQNYIGPSDKNPLFHNYSHVGTRLLWTKHAYAHVGTADINVRPVRYRAYKLGHESKLNVKGTNKIGHYNRCYPKR